MNEPKGSEGPDHPLDEQELERELAAMVEHNHLPPKVAARIGDKVKAKHLALSKTQLHSLVDRIQTTMQTLSRLVPPQEQQPGNGSGAVTASPQPDMKHLAEEIDSLKVRLRTVEECRVEPMKGQPAMTSLPVQPLESIANDPASIVVVMKWLGYLVEKRGKRNLPDILDYYVSIGWITDDVRLDLIGYSKGIIEEEPQAGQKGSAHLPTKDHLQSLLYVSKLKGLHLDDRFLYRIERDLEKLTRCLQDQSDQAPPNGH